MSIVTIALLQMGAADNDQDANLVKGEAFCRRAAMMGADIALFPEMWNIGYTSFDEEEPGAQERWQAQAVARDSDFVMHFKALAEELEMAIAITYLEQWQGAPRNAVSLIDRRGHILMTYAKVHTCDFNAMENACTPGDDFYVCTLDTGRVALKVGAMICYDREFPESARLLMLKGAELILTPNACTLETHRLGQFQARAYENMVALAMTNYAPPQANGHSIAVDGIAFGDEGSRDMRLVEAGEAEGIYLAHLDVDKLRAWRAREIWGNAFRRPHRYGLLTSLEVSEPFGRNRADGKPFVRTER
jgi:predicted amidohydrolase